MSAAGYSAPEIEEAAISALMQWESCLVEAQRRKITPNHFFSASCRTLYQSIMSDWEIGQPFDLVLFTHRLSATSRLESVGGPAVVTRIYANTCHSPLTAGYYFDIIQDHHAKRMVIQACDETIHESDSPLVDGAGLKQSTLDAIASIPDPCSSKPDRTFADAINDKINRMESGDPDGDIIPTGITKLDLDSPLRQGDMPLIAGERKAGKSILALSIACNVARAGTPVLYFSLEDREPKLIDRLFAGVSRIPTQQHHQKNLNETQFTAATNAVSKMSKMPFHIKDDIYDLPEMLATARQYKARHQIGLCVVDYAQLVRTGASHDRRELEVASVSRGLRLLAMELNTPIILLSQLNADGLTRESRALEQDATAMWKIVPIEDEDHQRMLEIPWQRNGPSGVFFKVTFLGELARVENYAD